MRWLSRLLTTTFVVLSLLHSDSSAVGAAPCRSGIAGGRGPSLAGWRCRRRCRFRCARPSTNCQPSEPDAAVAYWTRAIAQLPCNADAYAKRAEAWAKLGEDNKAIEDLGTAVRLDPNNARNYAARAELLILDENRRADALADISKALEIEPSNTQFRTFRGMVLAANHRESDAAAEMNTILKTEPGNAGAALMKAFFALAANGSPGTIPKEVEKELDAGDRAGFSLIAAASQMQQNKFAEAIAELTSYIASSRPDVRDGYALRAEAYIGAKQYALALADLDAVIRVAPDHFGAYARKAWLLATCPDARVRNGKLAVELATRACELKHWKRAPRQTLAAAYAEAGDFDKAVEQETQVLAELKSAATEPKAGQDSKDRQAIVVWRWPPSPPPGHDHESKLKEAAEFLECYRQHKPWRE